MGINFRNIFLLTLILSTIYTYNITLKNLEDTEKIASDCISNVLRQIKFSKDTTATIINLDNLLSAKLIAMNAFVFHFRPFYKNQSNLIFHDVFILNLETLTELKNGISLAIISHSWNPKAKYIVFIKEEIDLEETSKLLFKYNMFNITMILKTIIYKEYSIFNFNFELDSCNKPASQTLEFTSTCANYTGQETFLYKMPKHFKNCQFKMFVRERFPSIILDSEIVGVEEEILNIWKEKDNVTVEPIYIKNSEKFEMMLDNGSNYTRMNKYPVIGEVEGAIGGFSLTMKRAIDFEYTYPRTVDHDVVVIRRSKKKNQWEHVGKNISPILPIILVSFFVFCVLGNLIPVFGKKGVFYNCIIVIGYFINNTSKYFKSHKICHRIIVLSLLIYNFFINGLLQAIFSSSLSHPFHNDQENDLNLVISKYKRLGIGILAKKWEGNGDDFIECNTIVECLTVLMNSTELMYVTMSKENYMFYKWEVTGYPDDVFFVLSEHVVAYSKTVYFVRGSTVAHHFSEFLKKIYAGRINSRILTHLMESNKLKSLYHLNHTLSSFTASSLAKDYKEPFILLGVGYFLSIVIFLCEVMYSKRKICRKEVCSKGFKTMHKILYRHDV